MKRFALIAVLTAIPVLVAFADPASEVPYRYTQPDGSVVTLVNHGDEFFSWVTCEGVEVALDADGFWRQEKNASVQRSLRRAEGEARRARMETFQTRARASGIGMGAKRFIVVLVEFPDLTFTTGDVNAAIADKLNQTGYSDYDGTGSVKDYFTDSSQGQFIPTFDVYGPVQVSRSYAYYGQDIGSDHNGHATDIVREACDLLDDTVDFSIYDHDGDGTLDVFTFIFAGHSQSDGASSDHLWPHAYTMSSDIPVHDGVRIPSYSCSSEYRGADGTERAGIGTFCHEFGHTLGLPDMYDLDGSTNGTARTPGRFSVMASGNSVNNTHTPPPFTSIERQLLGWMGDFREIGASGSYTLGSLGDGTVPYIIPSDVDGEYFLLEMRDGKGWDAYIPTGMLIYHIDRSSNIIGGGVTAAAAWTTRSINRYGAHPCYYPVADDYSSMDAQVYPGSGNVTDFLPTAWSGDNLPYILSGISVSGTSALFSVTKLSSDRQIFGTVRDTDGNPVSGALLHFEIDGDAGSAVETTTGASGEYTLPVSEEAAGSFTLTASKSGYVSRTCDVSFLRLVRKDFILRQAGDSRDAELKKYPDSGSAYGRGYGTKPESIMGAVHFSASELQPYAGMIVRTISFQYAEAEPYNCTEAYVIIDKRGERILTRQADSPAPYTFVTVDVSDAGITVSGSEDLYIGYALKDVNAMYPILRRTAAGLTDGSYISSFSLTGSSWSADSGQAVLVSATLYDPGAYTTVQLLGYNMIANPGLTGGYSAGDTFTFALNESALDPPSSVTWYFDGELKDSASVVLSAGSHKVEALLTFSDGSCEVLTLEIEAE